MKTTALVLGVLGLFTCISSQAQLDLSGKTYVNVDAGVSIQQQVTSQITGGKITFDPGVRADFTVGYRINQPLAVEFQTGIIWNAIDKTGGVSLSSIGASADWYQTPVLANVVYNIPLDGPVHAYIGGGAGGVASSVYIDTPFGRTDDSDFVFAYQLFAGAKYSLNEHVDLGLAYKFLGSSSHDFGTFNGLNDQTYNHAVQATFSYNF